MDQVKPEGRCKTCSHWQKPDTDVGEIPNVGKCTAVVQFWNATRWSAVHDTRELTPENAGKLAFVEDGSDYYAALRTMPEFGCVQYAGAA